MTNKEKIISNNSLIDRAINKTNNLPIVSDSSEEDTIYPSQPINEVNFYDYDGTILYSYTLEEAQALAAVPPVPEHKGLICEGWNWALANIKSYGHAPINVGAMYRTDDNKTRLYIRLLTEQDLYVPLHYQVLSISDDIIIDWGDGTTDKSSTVATYQGQHNYSNIGDYIITFSVPDGSQLLLGTTSNDSLLDDKGYILYKAELGSNIKIGTAFKNCESLIHVTLPSGSEYGHDTFSGCSSLSHINIPYNGPSLDFDYITYLDNYCFGCKSLTSITRPNWITIGNMENAFNGCLSLSSITISDDLPVLGPSTFSNCCSFASMYIPKCIKNIYASTFSNCTGMAYYDFTDHTDVPNLANTNVFTGIPSDCEIRVPALLYNEWIAATNWSTYKDHIVYVGELPKPKYTNLALTGTTDPGGTALYDGIGYYDGMRWSSSGKKASAANEGRLSGWIPYKSGAVLRLKNFGMNRTTGYVAGGYIVYYHSDGTTSTKTIGRQTEDAYTTTLATSSTYTYFRISGFCNYSSTQPIGTPIITLDEEIIEN